MKNKKTAFTELGDISIELYNLHLKMWAGDKPLEIDTNEEWGRLFDVINERLNDIRRTLRKKITK